MSEAPDLAQFVQRRRLESYEQTVARQAYAYGVDVRRARWLARSSLGNAGVRAVDRAWTGLAERLQTDWLRPGADLSLRRDRLEELAGLRTLLRCSTPALWELRDEAADRAFPWAPVTPLGPAREGARWLVLDRPALEAMDDHERRFWLASGLAHLQCGHAVFHTAHLLVREGKAGRRVEWLRRLLVPWSRVMVFSSDRAGLLASIDLEHALDALEKVHATETAVDWLPARPSLDLRRIALEEFERSVVVARVRAARAKTKVTVTVLPMAGDREVEVVPPRAASEAAGDDAPKTEETEQAAANDSGPVVHENRDGPDGQGDPDSPPAHAAPEAKSSERAHDPDEVPHVPEDAWSVARCDRRLTERLGLL